MIISSVKLKNIRSYKEGEINFPEGTVLLSGDIGAGKSTILLALEFALFGSRRDLSGNLLLRKGSKTGMIEVKLDIDGKEILIHRELKKTKSDIQQAPGFIVIDGVKTILTALELKAKIIQLLGYPIDLLSRQKDIIFRYTVYTPQEDMKAILFEDKDGRLNTLRKVFGIDKYKIIRENCTQYNRSLKERKKELEGRIFDLGDKLEALDKKTEHARGLKEKLDAQTSLHEKLASGLTHTTGELDTILKEIKTLENLRARSKLLEVEIQNIVVRRAEKQDAVKKLMKSAYQEPRDTMKPETLKLALHSTEDTMHQVIKKMDELKLREQEYKTIIMQSETNKEKISKIDRCPLCEQNVPHSHKGKIIEREDKKIDEKKAAIEKIVLSVAELTNQSENLIKRQKKLRADYSESLVLAEKLKHEEKRKKEIELLETDLLGLKKKIGIHNQEKLRIQAKLKELAPAEIEYQAMKEKIDRLSQDERQAAITLTKLRSELSASTNETKSLKAEIARKKQHQAKLREINKRQNWLEDTFIKLTISMEKHVMSRLYHDFNDSFVTWFEMLMEDETLIAKLDETFNPVIEQNGYDTDLLNLSGGEKTSVALAYRLALNKVINDFISHIKTRDIIILDEPTDGFSDEQLDRVREVIDAIGVRQIIIVSHESKVESFVDSIIRVTKTSHESQAIKII